MSSIARSLSRGAKPKKKNTSFAPSISISTRSRSKLSSQPDHQLVSNAETQGPSTSDTRSVDTFQMNNTSVLDAISTPLKKRVSKEFNPKESEEKDEDISFFEDIFGMNEVSDEQENNDDATLKVKDVSVVIPPSDEEIDSDLDSDSAILEKRDRSKKGKEKKKETHVDNANGNKERITSNENVQNKGTERTQTEEVKTTTDKQVKQVHINNEEESEDLDIDFGLESDEDEGIDELILRNSSTNCEEGTSLISNDGKLVNVVEEDRKEEEEGETEEGQTIQDDLNNLLGMISEEEDDNEDDDSNKDLESLLNTSGSKSSSNKKKTKKDKNKAKKNKSKSKSKSKKKKSNESKKRKRSTEESDDEDIQNILQINEVDDLDGETRISKKKKQKITIRDYLQDTQEGTPLRAFQLLIEKEMQRKANKKKNAEDTVPEEMEHLGGDIDNFNPSLSQDHLEDGTEENGMMDVYDHDSNKVDVDEGYQTPSGNDSRVAESGNDEFGLEDEDFGISNSMPQVRIENGRIVVNQESITKPVENEIDHQHAYERVNETDQMHVTQATYAKRKRGSKWTREEEAIFYEALQQFGTDFSMMSRLFKSKNRRQIKNKFKREERDNPEMVNYCLNNRVPIDVEGFKNKSKEKQDLEEIASKPPNQNSKEEGDAIDLDFNENEFKGSTSEGNDTSQSNKNSPTKNPAPKKEEMKKEEEDDDEWESGLNQPRRMVDEGEFDEGEYRYRESNFDTYIDDIEINY